MADRPVLKQFAELKYADFQNHPVWVDCHSVDYEESWYDDANEETFRPWTEAMPVEASHAIFLVRASFFLADGTLMNGFITPSQERLTDSSDELGTMQPYLFDASGYRIGFWFGLLPLLNKDVERAYTLLGKTSEQIFPIQFCAEAGLARGTIAGTILGFYYRGRNGKIQIRK